MRTTRLRIGRQLAKFGVKCTKGSNAEYYFDNISLTARTATDISKTGDELLHRLTEYFSRRLKRCGIQDFELVLTIGDLPIIVSKSDTYRINGRKSNLSHISNILARLVMLSTANTDSQYLLKRLMKYMDMPDNIIYALENRIPYYWYEDYEKISVRLNVMQISDSKYAIEISDSLWGEINTKNLNTFISSYRKRHKKGSWNQLTPRHLYERLIGNPPSDSELKLMKAFLMQNRTSKLVEDRANELVLEVCESFPNNIFYHKVGLAEEQTSIKVNRYDGKKVDYNVTDKNNEWLFVRGQLFDWKIRKWNSMNHNGSRQSVSVYILSREQLNEKTCLQMDERFHHPVYNKETDETLVSSWHGPICIDNLASGGANSVGDQMVARALILMNDTAAIKLVSTLRSYAEWDMDKYRIDIEELLETNPEVLVWSA